MVGHIVGSICYPGYRDRINGGEILIVKGLTFRYPKSDRIILNNVSFELKKQKLNAIVGVNGSGKTTLFDCITGVLKSNISKFGFPEDKDILYLTQTIFFSPAITGKDFAKFIRRLDNKPAENHVEAYTKNLTENEAQLLRRLWQQKIGMYSVGERKWLFLTLLCEIDRELYIFDEPTSGVDPSSRIKIFEKINRVIELGKTCVISTHQLQDLSYLDCHLILLHNGEIKYEGDFSSWLQLHGCNNPDLAFEKTISGS